MSEPLCYWKHTFLPQSQLMIAPWDAGFVQGVTVAEQLRTFGGKLFRLERHLDRLADSLRTIDLDPQAIRLEELGRVALELAAHNHPLLAEGDDLGLSMFITPGPYLAFAPQDYPATAAGPTIGMHTFPVAFAGFAEKYTRGERLVVTNIRQVPGSCWPPSLKCRSRMHYYLADRAARRTDGTARALLLDQDGYISEASTANFVIYRRSEGLASPPREKILPGVSVATLQTLAEELQIPLVHRDFRVEDAYSADEAFLSSTSPCLLPVVSIDGHLIGNGRPGPIFQRLIGAWSRLVGIDIVQQAQKFSRR